jgi:hypothetical protein
MVSFHPETGPATRPVESTVTPVGSVSSGGEAVTVMSVINTGHTPVFA